MHDKPIICCSIVILETNIGLLGFFFFFFDQISGSEQNQTAAAGALRGAEHFFLTSRPNGQEEADEADLHYDPDDTECRAWHQLTCALCIC